MMLTLTNRTSLDVSILQQSQQSMNMSQMMSGGGSAVNQSFMS